MEILTTTRPEVVCTHNPADKHDTHIGVTIAALKAMRELPRDLRPKQVIGCEVWRNLDWLPDSRKVLMDVSGRDKPDAVLGLATGSTPLPLYQALIALNLDWSKVTTFNLGEYIGLPREHPQSYHSFMWENLFRHVNIIPEKVHIPDGNAADIAAFCASYEDQIRAAGGIDLQVLGIGTDGHIGFNEPTSSLASRTASRRSPGKPARTTRAFSAARKASRTTSSPWASAPSWKPA